jgi:hypothetical protein
MDIRHKVVMGPSLLIIKLKEAGLTNENKFSIMKKTSILLVFLSVVLFSNAQESEIIGKWTLKKMQKGDEIKEVDSGIIFDENGILRLGFFNMDEIIEAGTWKYDKNQNSILMSSTVDKNMNGKAEVIKVTEDELQYKKEGVIFSLVKYVESEESGAMLDFSEADFFTEDGDYKYDGEEDKLPWQDISGMIKSLEQVSKLVYDYSQWNETEKSFDKKLLTANVVANSEEMTLNIDYIFYGYDKYNLPEDTELPSNTEYTGLLYPEQEINFRIAGTEELTTPAGTLMCTVIEAVEAELQKKLWMINNKPGVYAKIIIEKPGMFGMFYQGVFELQEIKE